jgi:hypothetical protein
MDMHARSLEHSPQHIETYAPTHTFCILHMQIRTHATPFYQVLACSFHVLFFRDRILSFLFPSPVIAVILVRERFSGDIQTSSYTIDYLHACILLASFKCSVHMYIFVYTSICMHVTDIDVSQHLSSRKRG